MKIIFGILLFVFSIAYVVGQNTILWAVTSDNSNETSYLLGTYHQLGNSFVDSIPQIQNALYSCELSIFESLDNGEKVRAFLNKREELFTFKQELKKTDVAFLDTFAASWGIPISKLTPMELFTKLQQVYFETQCGTIKSTDTWTQIDSYLIHLSKTNNILTLGLENDSIQTSNINRSEYSGDWSKLKKPIHTWIKNIEKSRHTDKYCTAARNYINMSFNYQFDEKCGENPMLKGRNEKWMELLPIHLAKKSCFIAVGLLHLYGDCGLIEQLRKIGYTITPVELDINH